MIEIVTGDLFEAKEKYIAHVTNCVSITSAKGIAKDIFDKFPYADCYATRTEASKAGTIDIMGDGKDNRYIINMHAIVYPGRARFPLSSLDGLAARQKYFYHCLLRAAKIEGLESIAFPWRVGAGLAGGDFEYYLGTVRNFADYVEENGVVVKIYRKDGDE
jgi:O-acetyl-ADP-ribose deacetylase (regulator of RNase III)